MQSPLQKYLPCGPTAPRNPGLPIGPGKPGGPGGPCMAKKVSTVNRRFRLSRSYGANQKRKILQLNQSIFLRIGAFGHFTDNWHIPPSSLVPVNV